MKTTKRSAPYVVARWTPGAPADGVREYAAALTWSDTVGRFVVSQWTPIKGTARRFTYNVGRTLAAFHKAELILCP
jgi:hypothetical protein